MVRDKHARRELLRDLGLLEHRRAADLLLCRFRKLRRFTDHSFRFGSAFGRQQQTIQVMLPGFCGHFGARIHLCLAACCRLARYSEGFLEDVLFDGRSADQAVGCRDQLRGTFLVIESEFQFGLAAQDGVHRAHEFLYEGLL